MKFIDTFNEDDKKKLTKKAKLIFSVLKNGTITRSDGVKFSYELGDNMVVTILDGVPYVYAFINKIIERTYCPINDKEMSYLIRKKFDNFGIDIDLQIPRHFEFVKYEGKKPWELNESEDKGEIKARQVFKALRKGIFRFSDRKNDFFKYVLPENYEVYRDELGELCIKVIGDMDMFSVLKFDNNTDMEWPTEKEHKGLYEWMEDKITKKFEQFDIKIIFVKPEPINENYDERREKMIKKGKTVFKAFRKGVISDDIPDGLRFSYELSDDFTVDINNLGILVFTDGVKIKELNRACDRYSTGYMVSRIRNKFYQFDIVLTYPHVTSDDVERWEEPINEGIEDIGGGITEKELKKVKAVYKAIKKGFFKYDNHSTYGYELPDDYLAYRDYNEDRDEFGNVCIKMTGQNDQEVKYISKVRMGSSHILLPVQPHHNGLRGWIKERIINKFEGFNIKFIF